MVLAIVNRSQDLHQAHTPLMVPVRQDQEAPIPTGQPLIPTMTAKGIPVGEWVDKSWISLD